MQYCSILFGVILWVALARPQAKKATTYCYLFSYPVLRFIIEFFRGDSERGVALLSASQWISILLLVFGALLLWKERKAVKA